MLLFVEWDPPRLVPVAFENTGGDRICHPKVRRALGA